MSLRVKEQVREQVLAMLNDVEDQDRQGQLQSEAYKATQQRRLKALEIEYVIRALARQEEGILLRDGKVEVNLPGDEAFFHSEEEIRSTARALGVSLPGDKEYQAGRRLSTDFFNPPWMQEQQSPSSSPLAGIFAPSPASGKIDVTTTLTTTMHLVFPQHTNSHSIIFGGNTMSWSEDVALMACRNLAVSDNERTGIGSWKTVAMDGLEFNVRVAVGE